MGHKIQRMDANFFELRIMDKQQFSLYISHQFSIYYLSIYLSI